MTTWSANVPGNVPEVVLFGGLSIGICHGYKDPINRKEAHPNNMFLHAGIPLLQKLLHSASTNRLQKPCIST